MEVSQEEYNSLPYAKSKWITDMKFSLYLINKELLNTPSVNLVGTLELHDNSMNDARWGDYWVVNDYYIDDAEFGCFARG